MTLYEIDRRLGELADRMVDPETGEFVGDYDAWAALSMERGEKIENTALYVKNLRAEAEAIKAEADKLKRRRDVLGRRADWLEDNLSRSLAGENFETARCQLRFKKNPPAVKVYDEGMAIAYVKLFCQDALVEHDPTLNKKELKKLLQGGEVVPGVVLVQETRLEVV